MSLCQWTITLPLYPLNRRARQAIGSGWWIWMMSYSSLWRRSHPIIFGAIIVPAFFVFAGRQTTRPCAFI